jgi:putative ABC transport system permease protein
MTSLTKDFRYAFRSLLKQPAFTAVAVLTLALGIGANTTIFSVINALVLNPPRIADPDRVAAIWPTPKGKRLEGFSSYLNLQDWRSRTQSWEDIAGYKPNGFVLLTEGEAERIPGMRVTANFLPLMRVNLFRGRNFQPEEEKRGNQPVTIISYEFWRARFAGSEAVLDQQISLNGKPHTIIGIMPPDFEFPLALPHPEVWTTVAGEGGNLTERGANVLRVVGRLKPGVSLVQAEVEVEKIAANLEQEYPGVNRDRTAYVVGAAEQIVGSDVRRALWLLSGAVGFILLIACTNMANLLLARAASRGKEMALRAALGANRWRIARSLLVESALLSLISGAAGLLLAIWGLGAIKYYGSEQLPRLEEVNIDRRVLVFTFALSLLTGLLFSLIPTIRASRPDINEVLKSVKTGGTGPRSLKLWRDSLVVSEVALSLILLVGAGLMMKSFIRLVNVNPGFDARNVLTGRISLTRSIYEKPEQRVLYVNQTLEKLKALPGVESAAFVAPMPFSGGNVGGDFRIEGRPLPEPGLEPSASVRSVTPNYFESIRIPLIKGRHFTDQDKREGIGAAIINQSLAQLYFPNEDPLGKRISNIGANQNEGDPAEWEIVGVVGDVHHSSLTKAPSPELYLPYQQNSWGWGNFLIRTTGDPSLSSRSFTEQIRSVDKTVPITDVLPLTQAISDTVAQSRFYTFLFALFGATGLVLTLTGVYGLVSYTVSQRTQEIGIRMALGATRPNVLGMILRQGMVLTALGAVLGLGISFVLTRVIVSLLFEVEPTDLISFGGATAVLLAAALLASYIPARRATKVDPLEALRYE